MNPEGDGNRNMETDADATGLVVDAQNIDRADECNHLEVLH